jgi:hypothetical protein
MLIGNLSGYGCMHLYVLELEKLIAWILPYANTELFNRVLEDFAREFKLGAKKRVLLAIDQAGWHISKELKVPEGLDLILLPSHSPELQPAERLWTVVDEPIANRSFETLDDLEKFYFVVANLYCNSKI